MVGKRYVTERYTLATLSEQIFVKQADGTWLDEESGERQTDEYFQKYELNPQQPPRSPSAQSVETD